MNLSLLETLLSNFSFLNFGHFSVASQSVVHKLVPCNSRKQSARHLSAFHYKRGLHWQETSNGETTVPPNIDTDLSNFTVSHPWVE